MTKCDWCGEKIPDRTMDGIALIPTQCMTADDMRETFCNRVHLALWLVKEIGESLFCVEKLEP